MNSTFSPSGGSTVIVFDESGNIVEHIDGFEFLDNFSVVVPHLAINPSATSIGYVPTYAGNSLQSFTLLDTGGPLMARLSRWDCTRRVRARPGRVRGTGAAPSLPQAPLAITGGFC